MHFSQSSLKNRKNLLQKFSFFLLFFQHDGKIKKNSSCFCCSVVAFIDKDRVKSIRSNNRFPVQLGRVFFQTVRDPVQKDLEDICLKQDNGADFTFRGRLFSECSWFDEEQNALTRQKLYVTDTNDQVYYIVRKCGQQTTRHAYRLAVSGDNCVINNGKGEMTLQFDMLMQAVRGLCGMDAAEATPSLSSVEEMLRAANA